jgi:hypothetical protein
MKKILIIIACLIDVYYFSLWIYVFNTFDNQLDRRSYFIENTFFLNDIMTFEITLGVLNILALVFIGIEKKLNKIFKISSLSILILFMIFLIQSHL